MVPSLALGTGEVTLLELTSAYTAFANRGTVSSPRLITRVEDAQGITIYDSPERHTQAISPTTAYLMSSMLADVISSGTGAAARTAGFKLPAAGKTGTTDDYADAWFVGYTPHLVAGIWFGLDRPAPIMRGGFAGVVAVPAWGRFMKAATAGDAADWYEMPADVEKVAICRLSGARATDACRHGADVYSVTAADTPAQLVPADAMHRRGRSAAGADARGRRDAGLRRSVSRSAPCRASRARCTIPAPMGLRWRIRPRPRWSIHLSRVCRRPPGRHPVAARRSPWPGPPPPTSSSSASLARTA